VPAGRDNGIDRDGGALAPEGERSGMSAAAPVMGNRPALIVGIGASAGGLDACRSFLAVMPANSGMAFVLIQHLSPDHKSMLADLLGKSTDMRVIEATDGITIKANCVFVIPPDATMTIVGGRLKIVMPARPRSIRRPIDTFFQSLATDQGENAVRIILSGTGSDNILGVAAIKEQGGLTLAQAIFDHQALPGMPQSAPPWVWLLMCWQSKTCPKGCVRIRSISRMSRRTSQTMDFVSMRHRICPRSSARYEPAPGMISANTRKNSCPTTATLNASASSLNSRCLHRAIP
jgi:hypothetical protein